MKIGVLSAKLQIEGFENIREIDEDDKIVITEYENINFIPFDVLVIFVFNDYSLVEETNVYDMGFEYYVHKSQVQKVVKNILLNRLDSKLIEMFKESSKISIGSKEIQLSKKEFTLFAFLNTHRGVKCSRKQILSEVFNYHEDAETRIVDVYIKHLRSKLGDDGKKIETIRGEGYIYHK